MHTVSHPLPGFMHEWGSLSSTGTGIQEGAGGLAVRPLDLESAVGLAQVGQSTLQDPPPWLGPSLAYHPRRGQAWSRKVGSVLSKRNFERSLKPGSQAKQNKHAPKILLSSSMKGEAGSL